MNLVCLIGEQPIPNLLPILHLKPQQVLLVHTGNELSSKAARRLQKLCAQKQIAAELLNVGDAYRLESLYDQLREKISGEPQTEWCFNLTGGTKLMPISTCRVSITRPKPNAVKKSASCATTGLMDNAGWSNTRKAVRFYRPC